MIFGLKQLISLNFYYSLTAVVPVFTIQFTLHFRSAVPTRRAPVWFALILIPLARLQDHVSPCPSSSATVTATATAKYAVEKTLAKLWATSLATSSPCESADDTFINHSKHKRDCQHPNASPEK